jgi:hypothetical protein
VDRRRDDSSAIDVLPSPLVRRFASLHTGPCSSSLDYSIPPLGCWCIFPAGVGFTCRGPSHIRPQPHQAHAVVCRRVPVGRRSKVRWPLSAAQTAGSLRPNRDVQRKAPGLAIVVVARNDSVNAGLRGSRGNR